MENNQLVFPRDNRITKKEQAANIKATYKAIPFYSGHTRQFFIKNYVNKLLITPITH